MERGKRLLISTMGLIFAASSHADVIISQYVEGSSYNKAIEIANTGNTAISLDDYQLKKATNGSTDWNSNLSLAGITLDAGKTIVIAHSKAETSITAIADLLNNSVTNFNGNDAVGLFYQDALVDIVGVSGSSEYWGKDVSLVRQSTVTAGSVEFDSNQWDELEKDNLTGLGSFGEQSDDSTPLFSCTLSDGSEPTFTSIHDIQGEGSRSPLVADDSDSSDLQYFVRGVVSTVTTGLTKGFYLQSLTADNNDKTSEGLFVYTGKSSSDLQPGDVVCTQGTVKEYYGLTELAVADKQWTVLSQQDAPVAQDIVFNSTSDGSLRDVLERYEGMLVRLPKSLDMRIARTFSYDYDASRNNMVLAQGSMNYQPNQRYVAGSTKAQSEHEANVQRRLFIESDQKVDNEKIPYYPTFGLTDIDQNGSTEDYLRVNDAISGLEGVIAYSYDEYRLIVTNEIDNSHIVHHSPRTSSPELKAGNLRIASFNVLNYFNSPFGGNANQQGSNRGADNYQEFEIQQAKIAKAITQLDADIVGLMEIENNGFGDNSAIGQLVSTINSGISDADKHYQYLAFDTNQDGVADENDSVGTDAITVGLIYRPAKVELESSRIIPMPKQIAPAVYDDEGSVVEDGKNEQRDTIAPTFIVKESRHRLTVAVNHLKSKGSACWEDMAPVAEGGQGGDDADYQGNCENFRVAAAVALGDALNQLAGDKVILGDMNSYAKEDPILVLTDYSAEKYGKTIHAARNTYIDGKEQFGDDGAQVTDNYGYQNIVAALHPDSWSYSYNDEVGTLDHILISPTLRKYVVDATDWHINAAESTLFDYNDEYKSADFPRYQDIYRASDHDPAVLELQFQQSVAQECRPFSIRCLLDLIFGHWLNR